MVKKKIAIFHTRPLELYPPVMNLLDHLAAHVPEGVAISVHTTFPDTRIKGYVPKNADRIRILRHGRLDPDAHAFIRYARYVLFLVRSAWAAFRWAPGTLMYFETLSAGVPYLFSIFRKHTRMLVHYHEYMTDAEYSAQPIQRMLHGMERRMLSRMVRISHTNAHRVRLFLQDMPFLSTEKVKVMPNYPPRAWSERAMTHERDKSSGPIRLVYVGALDLNGMYVRELAEWVERKGGVYTLDLVTQQDDSMIKAFLSGFRHTKGLGYVPYAELPSLLADHDIGVILYKVRNDNFRYNAVNKLFEYLNCGLHVWYPPEMEGIHPYAEWQGHPCMVAVDYRSMASMDDAAARTSEHSPRKAAYFCEGVYDELAGILLKDDIVEPT